MKQIISAKKVISMQEAISLGLINDGDIVQMNLAGNLMILKIKLIQDKFNPDIMMFNLLTEYFSKLEKTTIRVKVFYSDCFVIDFSFWDNMIFHKREMPITE